MEPKPELTPEEKQKQSRKVLADFLKVFLVPTLLNKLLIVYFGLNYADHPGDGYGYGLAAALTFLVLSMLRFLWKYKDIEDP